MKKNLILQLLICLILISTQAFSQILKLNLTASPEGVCEGDSATLRVTFIPGVNQPRQVTYKWTANPPTAFFPDNSYPTVKVKPNVKTTFTIMVTNVDIPTDTLSGKITVAVTPRPVAFAGKDTVLCVNARYTMDPDVKYGTIFRWNHNGKGSYNDPTKLRAIYIPAPGETGWIKHTLTVTDYEFCHEVKDSLMLGYIEPPFAEIKPPVKQNICLDTKYLLTVDTKNNPAVKVKWRKDSGYGKILDSESTTMTYMPDPYDHGTVLFIVDAYSGGCHNADSISVPIAPIIFEYIPPSLTFCEGKTEFLYVTLCSGCKYKWSTGDTTNYIKLTPTKNTTLMVEVTNREGCYRKDTVDITVVKSPVIDTISRTDPKLEIITVFPPGEGTYAFKVNGQVKQNTTSNVFDYSAYSASADTVYVKVTNLLGCDAEDNFPIPKMKCPNAFSPNGDGINDILLQGRKITVFDRTEKILYQGWDGWDGTLNGRQMPEGTYFYIIFDKDNKVYCKTPVTILRKILTK
jgi:gliding motility-associated-like protein